MAIELDEVLDEELKEEVADDVSGLISSRVGFYLTGFVMPNKLGWVFGSETDFVIGKKPDGGDIKRRPDVAFCTFETLPILNRTAVPRPPDLAVEVTSSRDEIDDTDKKLNDYQKAKIKLVWVIRPIHQVIEVYEEGKPVGLLGIDDELDGSPVLTGFKLPLRTLFDGLPTI
jgi:Uma2 family endonuclease